MKCEIKFNQKKYETINDLKAGDCFEALSIPEQLFIKLKDGDYETFASLITGDIYEYDETLLVIRKDRVKLVEE